MATQDHGPRCMLWIDGVGGYLVCLGPEVSVGQADPQGGPDIGIAADLSRQHALFCREGEGYILQPRGGVWRQGQRLTGPAFLRDGDVLRLGSCVEVRFRQPHPLSRSARLEMLSAHRPQPLADGVLLMADTCVLGPGSQCHAVCRDWEADVLLMRCPGGLACSFSGPYHVDGQERSGRTELGPRSRVWGTDFCFSLEALE